MEEFINKFYGLYINIYETEKLAKIALYKQYLAETDYAVVKLYETVVQGGSIIEMLREYKEVLANRKEAREKIKELEKVD